MKQTIKFTGGYIYRVTPQMVFKCKRCKSEFAIIWNSEYLKTICYCPACGISAFPKRRGHEEEDEE